MTPEMADKNKQLEQNAETLEKEQNIATPEKTKTPEELKETTQNVGVEAGEIVGEGAEGAELTSGEVSEQEKKKKESYSGSNGAASDQTVSGVAPIVFPSMSVMRKEIKHELKKEIKTLHKKVNKVMNPKSKTFEPYTANKLMAQLRKLQKVLSSLAHATGDFLKDVWLKYVQNKETS